MLSMAKIRGFMYIFLILFETLMLPHFYGQLILHFLFGIIRIKISQLLEVITVLATDILI
jgi:hypothetical protein